MTVSQHSSGVAAVSSYSDNIVYIDIFFILQIYTKDCNKCSDQELVYTLLGTIDGTTFQRGVILKVTLFCYRILYTDSKVRMNEWMNEWTTLLMCQSSSWLHVAY